MDDKGKDKIIAFVGLCNHDYLLKDIAERGNSDSIKCYLCGESTKTLHQLDPTDPADMYGKIWPAYIKKTKNEETNFVDYVWDWQADDLIDLFTSPTDLAQALLDYIEQKEGE